MNTSDAVPIIQQVSSNEFIELQNAPCLANVDISVRKDVLSCAIGLAIARQLSVPTAPVESGYNYYVGNCRETVRNIVGKFNERVIINTELACEIANKVWCVRYFALHNDTAIPTYGCFGFFDMVMGVGNYVDEKNFVFLNEQKTAIVEVSNKVKALMEKIK